MMKREDCFKALARHVKDVRIASKAAYIRDFTVLSGTPKTSAISRNFRPSYSLSRRTSRWS